MKALTIKEILDATKGRLLNNLNLGAKVKRISTDSRAINRGDLFIALQGASFNGHSFIREAFAKGAAAAVVSKRVKVNKPVIEVKDTLKALGDIAAHWRLRFNVKTIGITGSNGKTTTKEIMFYLLRNSFRTVASAASFNNFIGVPLTVLRIDSKTEAFIQELETNILGGIRRLCKIARPEAGIVTNISKTHLDSLKTERGVFKEKAELIESLPKDGICVFNRDDKYFAEFKKISAKRKVVTFGIEKRSHFQAKNIEFKNNRLYFFLNGNKVCLDTLFYKNIYNALAAAAASCAVFGLDSRKAVSMLDEFKFLPMRAEFIKIRNIKVINDCFNANPQSVKDSLTSLKAVKAGRRIAVLGDMFELGTYTDKLHREIGAVSAGMNVDYLVCVGKLSRFIARGAKEKGLSGDKIIYCKTSEQAVEFLISKLISGDAVLVKGSRAMRLEKVITGLSKVSFRT